jgi:hypothetical protein
MDIMVILNAIKPYTDWIVYIIGFILVVQKIVKPIKAIRSDTALLLWNSLVKDHDEYMQQGYCSLDNKKRFCDLHHSYREKGLNGISDDFEREVRELPCFPAEKKE